MQAETKRISEMLATLQTLYKTLESYEVFEVAISYIDAIDAGHVVPDTVRQDAINLHNALLKLSTSVVPRALNWAPRQEEVLRVYDELETQVAKWSQKSKTVSL